MKQTHPIRLRVLHCDLVVDPATRSAELQNINFEPPANSAPRPALKRRPTPWQLLTGAVGILKAQYGVDAIDDDTLADRRATCESCDQYDFGVCGGAAGCNCYLAAKIRLTHERCPLGKWGPVENDQ